MEGKSRELQSLTLLSVNLNKIAVLRNSRGATTPSLIDAARVCVAAGCGGITVHPRPDQRHVWPSDVLDLAAFLVVELNIEGNPFAPARPGYPGLLALVAAAKPTQCTLVPDQDGQLTSDHGFDLALEGARLRPLIAQLKDLDCRVSLFMDAVSPDIERAADIGADRIEIYTGPYADAQVNGDGGRELAHCVDAAERARSVGLGVNAGHDLNQKNLPALLAAAPWIAEVSIGHALIGDALYAGLGPTVRAYHAITERAGQ